MIFSSSNTNHWDKRHGVVRTHAILFGDGHGGNGDSLSELVIENSTLSNNTQGNIHAGWSNTDVHYVQINSEILIDQPSASNQYIWINNSFINVTDCSTQTSYHSSLPRFCHPIILDGPTLSVASTEYYAPQGMEDIISGEIIRKWDLEVRVTDPDYQWTPNANVTVLEANSWSLGTQSTGSSGGATNFLVKEYSRSTTSRYDYTPHSIQVTMTNYSNSTSVSDLFK